MMLLAEIAREEGLFAWLAAVATSHAKGSARRLFLLTYGVGTIVTIFLSNDATAVVLTPAVAAAVNTAKAEQPLPYLLICAFIANAASFVLPISNPANLVIYGSHMPPLLHWLPAYLLPSAVSIAATYLVLRWTQRGALGQKIASDVPVPHTFRRRQDRGDRNWGDGHRSSRCVGVRYSARSAHGRRRLRDGAGRPDPRTQRTVARS